MFVLIAWHLVLSQVCCAERVASDAANGAICKDRLQLESQRAGFGEICRRDCKMKNAKYEMQNVEATVNDDGRTFDRKRFGPLVLATIGRTTVARMLGTWHGWSFLSLNTFLDWS